MTMSKAPILIFIGLAVCVLALALTFVLSGDDDVADLQTDQTADAATAKDAETNDREAASPAVRRAGAVRETESTATGDVHAPPPTGAVVGRVVRKGTEQPEEGVTIEVAFAAEGMNAIRGLTRDTGIFEIGGIPAGLPFTVLVHGSRSVVIPRGPFTVAAGDVVDCGTIELDLGAALHGIVADTGGTGIKNALVVVRKGVRWQSLKDAFTDLDAYFAAPPAVAQTRTNEKGEFEFQKLPEGQYVVEASADGYGSFRKADIWVNPDGVKTAVLCILGDPIVLSGWVKDQDGLPVAGCRLAAMPDIDGQDLVVINNRWYTEVDDRGHFEFPDLPLGKKSILVATPYGRVHQEKNIAVPGEITIRLQSGAVISGVVRQKDTELKIGGASLTFIGDGNFQTTRSNADGTYSVGPLKSGEYLILVDGTTMSIAAGKEKVRVRRGEVKHDIDLCPGATIIGKVVDFDTAEPVPGATVLAEGMFGSPAARTRSADDGTFLLTEVPLRDVRLSAIAPHYAAGPTPQSREKTRWEALETGQKQEGVILQLRRRAIVRGRVTNGAGSPIAYAKVGTSQSSALIATISGQRDDKCLTDVDGRYEIEINPSDRRTGVRVTHPEYGPAAFFVEKPQPRQVYTQDVVLQKNGWIEGRIRDTGGRPIVGVPVRISVVDQAMLQPSTDQDAAALGFFGMTDLAGEFKTVAPGQTCKVDVRLDGLMIVSGKEQKIQGIPEQTVRLRDIVVAKPLVLGGKVVDQDRRAVRGAKVVLERNAADGYSWKSSANLEGDNGRFQAKDLPEGFYTVTVDINDRYSGRYDQGGRVLDAVPAGKDDLTIVLKRY